ncbi:hypothetical protein ABZY57_25445 [Streptomyces sp. NPDC006450]|uniref:hypothetical protein n=1 Tax=Streptomyces sp. NPDC006450 TaxID=3155458 RepID=UPI0033AC0FA8
MQKILAKAGITMGALALAVGSVTAMASSAQANGASVVASFEGKKIDLSKGWGAAQACNVKRSGITCFRTTAESDKAARQAAAAGTFGAQGYCSTPLRLYEHGNYNPNGGRVLSFYDSGYWQNLGDWGFNDQTSSYRTGSCATTFAEHNWGGGAQAYVGAWVNDPAMGSGWWNDKVSSIWLH